MARKIAILFFLMSLSIDFLKAQETLPVYQQYLMDGEFLFNPAYYGKTDKVVLNMNYQKQFSKFSESPNVQSVGMHANIVDRVGAGVSFFRDQNGPVSANGISVGGSYFIPIGEGEERKDQFSFGTNLNFYNMNIDWAKLNPVDAGDPNLYNDSSIFMMYANLGMAVSYKNFFAGASVVDIPLTNDIPIQNGIEPQPTKIFLNAGYDWHLGEDFYITPSLMANLNTNSSRMLDLNLMATAKGEVSSFSGGLSFRGIKNQYGNQNLSVSPIIKGNINNFTFGAAYNFGMSDMQEYGGNSFMLSIGFTFDNFINDRGFRY